MARRDERFLHIEAAVAESRVRLGRGALEHVLELLRRVDEPHAASSTARRGLEQDGIAELVGGRPGGVDVDRVLRSGDERHSGLRHRGFRLHLVPHLLHRLGGRADEHQVVVRTRAHERRVFGQEAPSRVDGVAPRRLAGGDDRRDVEVALPRRRGADADRAIGHADVERVRVRGRVDRDRLDPEVVERADDADGHLAAVRDQDSREHA